LTTLSEALAAYRICAKAEGLSLKTVNWISDTVGYFSEFLGDGANDLSNISAQSLRQFILALQSKKTFSNHRFTRRQDKPLSPETIASYTRAVKTFFSFLEREEFIPTNPVVRVKLPKTPKKNMPTFSEKELERLFAQPDGKTDEGYRDYTIMLTLLDTGVRVSELCGLRFDDVDLGNGYLRVMGKGQKERYVPVGPKLTKAYSPTLFSSDGYQLVVMPMLTNEAKEAEAKTREAKAEQAEAEPVAEPAKPKKARRSRAKEPVTAE